MRSFAVMTVFCAFVLSGCSHNQGSGFDQPYDDPVPVSMDPVPVSIDRELPPISGNLFTITDGQDVVGQLQIVRARYEDTFVDFARAYGLGYDELVAANPDVDPWLPGDGTLIVLPTQYVLPAAPRQGVVLNVASKRLFYYPPVVDGEPSVVVTFPIGIGRTGWATPTGETSVVARIPDPIWFPPQSVRAERLAAGDPLPRRVLPGPENPLGRYAINLGLPGYLIHGTNKPAGVGMRVSHGCVRLYPEDIEYLFGQVSIGTPVRIVNQPYLFGWLDTELYFEAHAPLDEDEREWSELLLPMPRSSRIDSDGTVSGINNRRLREIAGYERGFPVPVNEGAAGEDYSPRHARFVTNILADGYSESAEPVGDSVVN
jgi:L,D-transpeptidase ErfK/SrfK